MKYIILFMIFPFFLSAQRIIAKDSTQIQIDEINSRLYNSGAFLKKADSQLSSGYGLMLLSGIGVFVGVLYDREPISFAGLGVTAIGLILQMSGSSHLSKAGKYLQKGTLSVPLNAPKKSIKELKAAKRNK